MHHVENKATIDMLTYFGGEQLWREAWEKTFSNPVLLNWARSCLVLWSVWFKLLFAFTHSPRFCGQVSCQFASLCSYTNRHTQKQQTCRTCRSRSSSTLFWLRSSSISCSLSLRSRFSSSTLKYIWRETHILQNLQRKHFEHAGWSSFVVAVVHFCKRPVRHHSCPGFSGF